MIYFLVRPGPKNQHNDKVFSSQSKLKFVKNNVHRFPIKIWIVVGLRIIEFWRLNKVMWGGTNMGLRFLMPLRKMSKWCSEVENDVCNKGKKKIIWNVRISILKSRHRYLYWSSTLTLPLITFWPLLSFLYILSLRIKWYLENMYPFIATVALVISFSYFLGIVTIALNEQDEKFL